MPGLNKSGPMGAGPMTGWKRGLCRGASASDASTVYERPGYGRELAMRRGFRCGSGAGWGRGHGFGRGMGGYPPTDAGLPPVRETDEKEMLGADEQYLKNSLEAINKRIEALENQASH